MKHILLPVDGSIRSIKSVDLAKSLFKPDEVHIYIIMVREDFDGIRSGTDFEELKKEAMPQLEEIAQRLDGFDVSKHVRVGHAGDEILKFSEAENVDTIIMTKSTRKGWTQMIGSVTTHVVKYAKCIVMIIPES